MSKEIICNFRFCARPCECLTRLGDAKPKAQIIKNLPSVMNVGSWDGINGEPKSSFWNQLAALALELPQPCPHSRFVNLRLRPFALSLPWSSHPQTPRPQ